MKVIELDLKKKEFKTEDGCIYPILFDIDENVTIVEFQKIIDESCDIVKTLMNE